jgi:hypothetical protein
VWIAVVVSVISAAGAVVAALVAGHYAGKSKQAELSAARVLELEKRLAGMKEEVYRPMVELLRSMWDSAKSGKQPNQAKMLETLSRFTAWAQMYGSDDVVIAHHKMMQAAFTEPPSEVMMRYIAEMTLALRKDLGDPETRVDAIDLLGMRIKDIYEGDMVGKYALGENEFSAAEGWTPPWGDRFGNRD